MRLNKQVNFSTAKVLKEKGFGIHKKYQNYYIENNYYDEDGELIECETQSGSLSLFEGIYSAPTVTDVAMWLYLKHGIWIEVTRDVNAKFCWSVKELKASNNNFKNPTEAYEAAIEYTLNNLI